MAKLPNTLLLTYQAEYESTNINIDDLCVKYGIETNQLKGYTKWIKTISDEVITATEVIVTPKTPVTNISTDTKPIETTEELLLEVDKFKKLAVAHAVSFMDNAEFAEVKEFKDMVAIVDSIEKSYKDTKDNMGTTINIAIQNLVEKFKDDC